MRDIVGFENNDIVFSDTIKYQLLNFGYTQLGDLQTLPDWGIDYNSFLFFRAHNPYSVTETFKLSPKTFLSHIQQQLIKNNLDISYTSKFTLKPDGGLTIIVDKISSIDNPNTVI